MEIMAMLTIIRHYLELDDIRFNIDFLLIIIFIFVILIMVFSLVLLIKAKKNKKVNDLEKK